MAGDTATNELIRQARCFDCLNWSTQAEIQTYLIAYASGGTTDPNELALQAKCLRCLSPSTLLEAKAYLLASIAGTSTDTNTLANLSKCFTCIPNGYLGAIDTYLLASDPGGPGITSPNALASAAKSFQSLNAQTLLEIQVYLLAVNAGVSTDPNELAYLARCFKCLPNGLVTGINTYLLDQAETGGGVGGDGPNIVPPGATYPEDDPIYILDVLADTFYLITWGTNELQVQIGTDIYMSTGAGTSIKVNTGTATQMIFTGIFGGTTVTVVVKPQKPPAHLPNTPPSNFAFTLNGDETLAIASWDPPPPASTLTEVWTSTDGTHFSYAITVPYPGTSGSVAAPAPGDTLWAKAHHCNGKSCAKWSAKQSVTVIPITTCGTITTVITVSGAGEADANGDYVTNDGTTFTNAATNWYIEFLNGSLGVEAYLYNDLAVPKYQLPLGQCFPCGHWAQAAAQPGALPVPTMVFGNEGNYFASEWADRVVTNGGVRPSNATITAAATFLDALQTAGIRDKMKAVNIFAPDNLTAALTPLIKGVGIDPWTNSNFVSGDLTVDGLLGASGSSKALNTGLIGSANWQVTSCGVHAYMFTRTSASGAVAGTQDGGGEFAFYPDFSGTAYWEMWSTASPLTWAPSANGFYSCNRTAANARAVYFAKSSSPFASIASDAVNVGTVPTSAPVYVFAWNNNGTRQFYLSDRISFIAFSNGLSSTESLALYNAVQALRTALGGGYV